MATSDRDAQQLSVGKKRDLRAVRRKERVLGPFRALDRLGLKRVQVSREKPEHAFAGGRVDQAPAIWRDRQRVCPTADVQLLGRRQGECGARHFTAR